MKIYEIQERDPQILAELLKVWEASVRETHLFFSEEEVNKIKTYVPQALSGGGTSDRCPGGIGRNGRVYGSRKETAGDAVSFPGSKGKGPGKAAASIRNCKL